MALSHLSELDGAAAGDELVAVSYSELDAYRQCPLKHYIGYKHLWTADAGPGTALWRGTGWHSMLEAHYRVIQAERRTKDGRFLRVVPAVRRRRILEQAEGAAAKALADYLSPHRDDQTAMDEGDLLWWMYQGHRDYWGIDDQWEILGVELEGVARLPLPTRDHPPSRFILRFKMDLVVRDLQFGRIEIVDHKSAKDFSRPNEIDVDDQQGLYTWAAQSRGVPVFQSIRSDARTYRHKDPRPLEDRFRRTPTFRHRNEVLNLALDATRVAAKAYGETGFPYSSPSPDRCTWRCGFIGPHLAARKGIPLNDALRDWGLTQREGKHPEYNRQLEGLA